MDGGRQATLRGVLFTDMVGSTQLRSELGDDRADALRRDHNALLGSAVTAHGGRVLRWTGDGIKADFPTSSAAMSAAMEMQREVAAYGRTARAVSAFQIRIGVSAGEVVVEGNEAHGIAVVEAARLEPLAAPGEILATDLAQRLGQRRVDATFEEVGSYPLKGLDEPVNVVRVIDASTGAAERLFSRTLVIDRRFPLVGRGEEVRTALASWSAARSGSASSVFFAGPAGIGKSRLVAQVADRAHTDGAVVLAGTCDSDLAVPFEPFAMAFAEAATADDELGRAVASGAGPLGALFPTRQRDRIDEAGASDRFELFEAVVAMIGRLADDQPVVLVLDDLHWATSPTVQLLRHVLRRTEAISLLVLASYRPEEVQAGHPMHELLVELRTAPAVTVIALEGIAPHDVAELVAARVPTASEARIDAFAHRLFDESAGSPFFACELLHHLTATGELERLVEHGDAPTLPLPDSVRDVIDRRLARLPAGADELLASAAVVGASFSLEVLAGLGGTSVADVLDRCEDLSRMALVQEVDAGRFAFTHALVRTAVLERLSASRLVLMHRRVAEAIETLGRPDHDELAHHWMLAGVEDRASEHLERAAERDLEALAFESALDRYEALLVYHHGDPTGDVRARARAWLGLGLARRALGQQEFLDAVEEAGRLARRLQDVDLLADAAIASIWPGNFFVTAGTVETTLVELGEDALGLLEADDPRRARVLSTVAAHLSFDPDRERRVGLLAEATVIARQVGNPGLIGSVLVAEHLAIWDATTSDRRAEIAIEVGRLARSSGDVELEFFGGFLQAFADAERGRIAEARQRLARLDEPITATQNPYFAFLAERLDVSLDLFTHAPDVQERIDGLAKRYADTYADTDGTWALQTGYLTRQEGTLDQLLPAMRAMVDGPGVNNWMAPFGLALLAAGERDEAEAVYDRLETPPLDYFWLTTVQASAELVIELGRLDGAAEHVELLTPHRNLVGITATGSCLLGLVVTSLGHLHLALGHHEVADGLLGEAVARSTAIGAAYESVKARRLLASNRLAMGRPVDEVAPLVRSAIATADDHGFAVEHRLLRELGAC